MALLDSAVPQWASLDLYLLMPPPAPLLQRSLRGWQTQGACRFFHVDTRGVVSSVFSGLGCSLAPGLGEGRNNKPPSRRSVYFVLGPVFT